MEYTLEDAWGTLKDNEEERQYEIENLVRLIVNSGSVSANQIGEAEEIRKKQHKLCHNLVNQVVKEEPRDYPVPKTSDLIVEAVIQLEKEVHSVYRVHENMEAMLSEIKEDISYLKDKMMGLDKMKTASLNAAKLLATANYNREYRTVRSMFKEVKEDLFTVVNKIFPENEKFHKYLATLISQYTKGGDDLYVDVTPETYDLVNFLLEADIIKHHSTDKTKVKLANML
ncbi:uncharacterized protein LOC143181094 isoform X2 [Calliopsis andreniformis]